MIREIESTGELSILHIELTRDYLTIYEKNVDKIGLLPAPLPEKIIRFYTLALAVLDDLDKVENPWFKEFEAGIKKIMLEQLLELFEEGIQIGKEARSSIRSSFKMEIAK